MGLSCRSREQKGRFARCHEKNVGQGGRRVGQGGRGDVMIRVLIVDDDFMVAKVHSGYVAKTPGFEVVGVAHTGADAVHAAEELRPDLVLLDIYLPDMDGVTVLRSLRSS